MAPCDLGRVLTSTVSQLTGGQETEVIVPPIGQIDDVTTKQLLDAQVTQTAHYFHTAHLAHMVLRGDQHPDTAKNEVSRRTLLEGKTSKMLTDKQGDT